MLYVALRVLYTLQVLTKDNPSLWTQLPPAAQVRRLNIHRQVEGVVLCNTPPSTQVAVKAELLKCMTAETRRSILRKVGCGRCNVRTQVCTHPPTHTMFIPLIGV